MSKATPYLEKSIAAFVETNAENDLAKAYKSYGHFYKKHGNLVKAREYLTKALEIFERLGTMIEPDKVKKELASLSEE